jgi:hypothetical protein
MELWNNGIMGKRKKQCESKMTHCKGKTFLYGFKPNTPKLHYSNIPAFEA